MSTLLTYVLIEEERLLFTMGIIIQPYILNKLYLTFHIHVYIRYISPNF